MFLKPLKSWLNSKISGLRLAVLTLSMNHTASSKEHWRSRSFSDVYTRRLHAVILNNVYKLRTVSMFTPLSMLSTHLICMSDNAVTGLSNITGPVSTAQALCTSHTRAYVWSLPSFPPFTPVSSARQITALKSNSKLES